jgi:glycolate oxidase
MMLSKLWVHAKEAFLAPASNQQSNAAFSQAFIKALLEVLGSHGLLSSQGQRLAYECDACILLKEVPGLVAVPKTLKQVAQVLKLCHQFDVPFVARGAGTGLSGGAVGLKKGVLLHLAQLNQILEINTEKRYAWVEVGVVNASLNEALAPYGLHYGPDPSSQAACTLGGNVAENAGGIHCFKSGVTTDHVLALELITPQGEVLHLGSESPSGSAYDWRSLVVGSEGTLGVVSKLCVRLLPLPQEKRLYQVGYATMEQATGAIAEVIRQGLNPSAMEYLDKPTVWAVNRAFNMGFPEPCEALLLVEVAGSPAQITYEAQALEEVLNGFKPLWLSSATDAAACKALWKARKGTVAAYGMLQPAFYVQDCVIPRSKLTEVLQGIEAIGQHYELMVANVFHAADGNLHPNLLFNPNDSAMVQRVMEAGDAIMALCLKLGGTLSGEHGIGLEKIAFMSTQFSDGDLNRMWDIKTLLDPKGLANPGKLLPAKATCGEQGVYHKHEGCLDKINFTGLAALSASRRLPLTQDGEEGLWI